MRSHAKAGSAGSTGGRGHLLALLGLVIAGLLLSSVPAAMAAPTAVPSFGYFASFDGGDGVFFGRLRNPIAVDGSGTIFAADENFSVLRLFTPDPAAGGVELTQVETPGVWPADVAIDTSDDALYVQSSGQFGSPAITLRFTSDGKSPPTYTADSGFEVPAGEGIAVDPVTHDLLVANGGLEESILRYSSAGALLSTIATPGIAPQRIAVAPDGSIYVTQESTESVYHLSGTGTLLNEIENVGATQALTYDATRGMLVVLAGGRLKAYSPSGSLQSDIAAHSSQGAGLAIDNASDLLYEFTTERANVNVYAGAILPGLDGLTISDVTGHGAHLSVEVDPGAGPPPGSEVHFEYSADGGKTWQSTPEQTLSSPTTAEADLTGLPANFEYLIRAVASNDKIDNTTSAVAFNTAEIAPEVVTNPATDVSETSAVLNGSINPDGLQTSYYFEYGTTTAYGSRVPVTIDAVAGGGRAFRAFSRTLTSLAPATTYHFRIVAQNSEGTTVGEDVTFTTVAAGATPVRGYEQVTPLDKKGNAIDENVGYQAKADGSALVYATRASDESSPLLTFQMAKRGSDSWQPPISLDPPLGAAQVTPLIAATLAVSPDFTHALVATNRALTPQATEGGLTGVNLYIRDLQSGGYTFIASDPNGLESFIGFHESNKYVAGAPDFSWVVFRSRFPLINEAPYEGLYRWSESDGLELISILPDGEPVGMAFSGSADTDPARRTVSVDGSRIYFDAEGSERGTFLWEAGQPTRAVSVSQIPNDSTTPHMSYVFGTSEDGRFAFIQSNEGKLTSDAPGNPGDMYRYDALDGSLEYLGGGTGGCGCFVDFRKAIGVARDGSTVAFSNDGLLGVFIWRDGVLRFVPGLGLALSPGGRYLVSREGNDAYLYDVDTDQLSCASCLPDGSSGGASVPGGSKFVSNRISQVVTDSGQLFYTSRSRLVAADVNGDKDVYMFQDGKNRLISTGDANYTSILSDISEDGHDVFFTTNQKLVGQDNDESVDVYDARIGGGLASQNPPPPQECLRDDCKATPNAGPELPFGGSEALSGPGNVTPTKHKKCGKGKHAKKVKGKVRCVNKHRVEKHKANKNKKGGNR